MFTLKLTNMVPIENKEVALVHKYTDLGHEIRILRDNQTCELNRDEDFRQTTGKLDRRRKRAGHIARMDTECSQ